MPDMILSVVYTKRNLLLPLEIKHVDMIKLAMQIRNTSCFTMREQFQPLQEFLCGVETEKHS